MQNFKIMDQKILNPQDINWTPFINYLKAVLNLNTEEITMDFNGKRPIIICPDLTNKSGIFSTTIKSVQPQIFNYICKDTLWCTVYLDYASKSGGTNGMQIFTAWFQEGQWIFKSE